MNDHCAGDRKHLVLAVTNQAGSAGKTTTAVTVAGLLAEEGRKVRLIDLDAQANATWWLTRGAAQARTTSGDVLTKRSTLDDASIETVVPGLILVPAAASLDGDALELMKVLASEQTLRQALAASTEDIDVTVIDCPGSLGLVTVAALVAATSVVTVATPSMKEISGVPKLIETTEVIRGAYNPGLHVAALVPCQVPPSSAGQHYGETLAFMQATWGDLVTDRVRRSVRVPEAYSARTPLHLYAPSAEVTNDYRSVMAVILDRAEASVDS